MSEHDKPNGGLGWRAGECQCYICGHEWVGVCPEVVSDLPLECPSCGREEGFYLDDYK